MGGCGSRFDLVEAALDRRFAEGLVWARWAVARWDAFPAEHQPRPLVLVGERAFVEQGFATGEAKLAFIQGHVESAVPVPTAVLARLVRRVGTGRSESAGPPLVITEAAPAQTEFVTDRGRRLLPAWRLTAIDALGPIWVLDPDLAPGEWQPAEPPAIPRPTLQTPPFDPGRYVEAGPGDATLTLHFMGALPEYERYRAAEVIESAKAVAIVPKAEDIGPPGARILPGYGHQVTVKLASPIGPRVFVDLHGHARQVLPASSDRP
jgi:hypothetical protein